MSSTLIEDPTRVETTTRPGVVEAAREDSERNSSPWRWMVLACLFLGLSGGVRFWRDHQFAKLSNEGKDCPFPLADLSKTLGTWQAIDNSDMKLDPEIARTAGSTDHLIRTYSDSKTGEKIHVLLLYGLAQDVFAHTPEICYPASGQAIASQPRVNEVEIPGRSEKVNFRSQVFYYRTGPGNGQYTEVLYSFRHGGKWRPDMAGEWKSFRYQPGMYKIQTSRDVSAGAASPDAPEPKISKSLVTEIVKDLEKRIASATKPAQSQG